MIHIPTRDLETAVAEALRAYQEEIDAVAEFETRVNLADQRFSQRNRLTNGTFREIRNTLDQMCAGARRCMYCEDSAADEIEHHRPKKIYPEQVFAWQNYLYACGPCNSPKNNKFAIFGPTGFIELRRRRGEPIVPPPPGDAVLLDPRSENPMDYMILDIVGDTFFFVPIHVAGSVESERAAYTISVLGLNRRDYLPVARREAFHSYFARLTEYIAAREAGVDTSVLVRKRNAIQRMQHPSVWREMRRQRLSIPGVLELFDSEPEALTW